MKRHGVDVSDGSPNVLLLHGFIQRMELGEGGYAATIRERFSKLKSRRDLVDLLNYTKRLEMGEAAYPIQLKQITYYADPRTYRPRYTHFEIPKRSGGMRQISTPVRGLKSILQVLNWVLSALYKPSPCTMGFVKGRSVVNNAEAHLGQHYVYNIDLKDFFPSITKARVYKRLTLPPFNLNRDLANIVSGLCTMRVEEGDVTRYVLPQGAPTSPVITNMICQNLDRRLMGVARRFGLRYTRYADDITFSCMRNLFHPEGEFIKELERVIALEGFTINEKKTRLQRSYQRRSVTGLVLSDRVNVTRRYVRELRQMLYIWRRYGLAAATVRLKIHYCQTKPLSRGLPPFEAVVRGKLQYLRMVRGEQDPIYKRFALEFARLLEELRVVSFGKVQYVSPCRREFFERALGGKLVLRREKGATICEFVSSEHRLPISVSGNIEADVLKRIMRGSALSQSLAWAQLEISLLRRPENKHSVFLLHKRLKPEPPPSASPNVEALLELLEEYTPVDE